MGNCDFISEFWLFFFAIVNLQYLTILIKSELQDVNSQFQYRSELWDKKVTITVFTFFYSVTETSLHSNQRPCMLELLLVTASAIMGAPSTSNTHPQEGSRFQLNFCIGDSIFFYCTFYKVMTHSVLDSMLPRMNTM